MDSEEDKTQVSVEEVNKVMELCNVRIVENWGITNDISQTCSRNVPVVPPHII